MLIKNKTVDTTNVRLPRRTPLTQLKKVSMPIKGANPHNMDHNKRNIFIYMWNKLCKRLLMDRLIFYQVFTSGFSVQIGLILRKKTPCKHTDGLLQPTVATFNPVPVFCPYVALKLHKAIFLYQITTSNVKETTQNYDQTPQLLSALLGF